MKTSLFGRRYTPSGAPPGSVEVAESAIKPVAAVLSFNQEELSESSPQDVDELVAAMRPDRTTWIDVHGLGDGSLVRKLGERLGYHALALADVVNVGQRPKADRYGDTVFVAVRMVTLGGEGDLLWEQVSVFFDHNRVVSFQERPGDCLEPLRNRLREGRANIRGGGGAYLACMIIDSIVDGYFPVLDAYAGRLEALEEEVFERPNEAILRDCYRIQHEFAVFRRAILPLREALGQMHRNPDFPLPESVLPYLRDTLDHLLQFSEVVDGYSGLVENISEVYLTHVNQRTNEIMRTLTVVSTIFIPLTFLAGVYGMNFDRSRGGNMPELGWRYGYLAFWIATLTLAAGLLLVFRRAGWLGKR